jgi:hypothetical protein
MAADGLKVLGQSAPAATTVADLYTVPAATKTTVSTLTVCNRSATATTFRVAVSPAGATLANQHYIYFDQAIDGNSTFASTIGMTLSATDVIRVYAGTLNLSFSAFGVEVA